MMTLPHFRKPDSALDETSHRAIIALVLERVENDDGEHRLFATCMGCMRGSPRLQGPESCAERQLVDLGWAKLLDQWACPVCQTRHGARRQPRT